MDATKWLLGGTAAAAVIGLWGYIRGVWTYLVSFVIVTQKVDTDIGWALAEYCYKNFKYCPYGPKEYGSALYRLKASQRISRLAFERLGFSALFFSGKKPIWFKLQSAEYSSGILVTYFRGMFNFEQLLVSSMRYLDSFRHDKHRKRSKRFKVVNLGGTWALYDARRQTANSSDNGVPQGRPGTSPDEDYDLTGLRPVGWSRDDVGAVDEASCVLGDLALSHEAEALLTAARRWSNSRGWYEEHRVPYKFGIRLVGQPGCGKTALTRGMAFELDLPVFMFDLATMTNDDLRDAWKIAMSSTPCVTLFEDIDAVFDKRTPVNKDSPLTFDTLLQCLDGIEQNSGVLTVVTTNNRDKLDPALTREGRTDFEVEMTPPDEAGRRKIAERICCDWPELIEQLVAEHAGKTGAAFQHICSQAALERFWSSHKKEPANVCVLG